MHMIHGLCDINALIDCSSMPITTDLQCKINFGMIWTTKTYQDNAYDSWLVWYKYSDSTSFQCILRDIYPLWRVQLAVEESQVSSDRSSMSLPNSGEAGWCSKKSYRKNRCSLLAVEGCSSETVNKQEWKKSNYLNLKVMLLAGKSYF